MQDVKGLRAKQDYPEDINKKIRIEKEILELMESLKGYERNYFEKCVIYSSILFAFALLTTYVDFGKYIDLSNSAIIVFFSFFGLYYFSKMIQAIFFALNIVKTDQ